MKGELILVDNIISEENEFEIGIPTLDFCLLIYVGNENTLEKQLKNRKSFDYCMNELELFWALNGEINEDELKEKEYISKHFANLLDSVEYIKLSFEKLDNMDFIKKNPLVLSKKIVLNEKLDITDYDKLIKLMDEYNEIADKIYISLTNNTNYVSLIDCYRTMHAIKMQTDKIKKLGLSPMETIMYVYDQVRSREYAFENEDESYFKSRDLSEVLFGDKIVCLGYANIFNALLNSLQINNQIIYLLEKDNSQEGHARNVIYVKDPKYDIDGVYYFDPTWDRKRKNETNEYLYRYTYFAKTRKYMDDVKNCNFEDCSLPLYSIDMDKKIRAIIEEDKYEELMPYIKSLNYMSNLITNSPLINFINVLLALPLDEKFNKQEFLRKFEEIFNKFDKEISAETMLKVFNNVRKIEYYQNPILYPYSLNDIYITYIKSKWKFKDKHLNEIGKILQKLFGEEEEINQVINFKNYGYESELFKEMEQVKLAKVLRLVYDKKKSQKR